MSGFTKDDYRCDYLGFAIYSSGGHYLGRDPMKGFFIRGKSMEDVKHNIDEFLATQIEDQK